MRIPSAFRLAPAAAGTSGRAARAQAVTSSSPVHPDSTAAVHSTSTLARECRIPRRRRCRGPPRSTPPGSRPTPPAARLHGRPNSARASAAAAGTGMRDWTRNGASGAEKRHQQSLVLAGTPLPSAPRRAPRQQRDATGIKPAARSSPYRIRKLLRPGREPPPRRSPEVTETPARSLCPAQAARHPRKTATASNT